MQVSVKFFSFHVLDLATRIRLLQYVMQSVTVNGGQVLATLLLGVLLCYIFAVVGTPKRSQYLSYAWHTCT